MEDVMLNGTDEVAMTEPTDEVKETAQTEDLDECSAECNEEQDDLKELQSEFPELSELSDLEGLRNPARYYALRKLGLAPGEAYLLTERRQRDFNDRAHLTKSVPAAARSPRTAIPSSEMSGLRELFSDMNDGEINSLYKKVTK